MQHVHIIKGLEPIDDLAHKISGLLLREFTSDLTQFIKVTTVAILREQVEVILSFLNIV